MKALTHHALRRYINFINKNVNFSYIALDISKYFFYYLSIVNKADKRSTHIQLLTFYALRFTFRSNS